MAAQTKATTQDHLDIYDIKNDMVFLKNGSVSVVLQTTAVNFDLLSEIEQDAIIAAFSMLLNSLTFPIQVVLRSKKLDITKYIDKIKLAETKIKDPLMKHQAEAYRKFVQDVIQENEVLTKSFYVVLTSGSQVFTEPGSGPFDWVLRLLGKQAKRIQVDVEQAYKDAQVSLLPKVEHMIGEFNRLGVRIKPLTTQELVELYFDIYNPSDNQQGQRIRTNVEDYKTAIVNPALAEE